jgi:hypothetical protein
MQLLTALMLFIATFFSVVVMSYVSMATPVGPWIAPVLVLVVAAVYVRSGQRYELSAVRVAVTGSIGGIVATAFGFSFPTIYFLDAALFSSWMADPVYFMVLTTALAGAAGWYGMWIADVTQDRFLMQSDLHFPVAHMVYKMIVSGNRSNNVRQLMFGFAVTSLFCMLSAGIRIMRRFSLAITVLPDLALRLSMSEVIVWPLLCAIGFVSGAAIIVPLSVGVVSKVVLEQLMSILLPLSMPMNDAMLAFCCGMVVAGAIYSCVGLLKSSAVAMRHVRNVCSQVCSNMSVGVMIECLLPIIMCMFFFSYCGFSVYVQIYVLVASFMSAYQVISIAGKLGLAQLGRFATFVLMPALFLFDLSGVQAVIISTFAEISAGVAVDALCGRKLVQLFDRMSLPVRRYQYAGLLMSSLFVGAVLWLLIQRFGLGSAELFAQRSQARALLIGARQFDFYALLIGAVFGAFLRIININSMLVLGGLLMPISASAGFVFGGVIAYSANNKDNYYPFCAGVFAATSIWMLIRALG